MNIYKRFTTYLIENHPLTWHSKVIQLISVSILFSIISFIIGYNITDLNVLKNKNLLSYYFDSSFIFFHIIFCVIIISIWAIYFFKNNAFKNYYPLQKGYFTKLFFHIFIPILILISAYFPFTDGCYSKASTYFTEEELKSEINTINLANVFLIQDVDRYKLANRIYPKPYPIDEINFQKNENRWEKSSYSYVLKNNKTHNYTTFNPELYEEKSIQLNGDKKLFVSKKYKYIDEKKCLGKNIIYKVYSKNELDNPTANAIQNFSSISITKKSEKNFFRFYDYNEGNSNEYKSNYAPIIHNWVTNKKYNQIQNSIEGFKAICKKYEVGCNLNSKHILRFLIYKEFKNFRKPITKTYEDNYSFYNPQDEINLIESMLSHKKETIRLMASQHVYFYDKNELESVFFNLKNIHINLFSDYYLLPFLFIALFLTWLFICFEFTVIKSFLISIPIIGVLIILNSLTLIYFHHFGSEANYFLIAVNSTTLLIIGYTLIALYSKKVSKKIINVLINLTYLFSPIFIMLLVLLYNAETRKSEQINRCTGRLENVYTESVLMHPYLFFLYAIIGILLFFTLLKKWKAYEE
ncbi:MAG: hypothetical protein HYR91_07545 [Flavobacteriia bacterium]|nr:hypothetical protein [Flavobacteriia bacterium]